MAVDIASLSITSLFLSQQSFTEFWVLSFKRLGMNLPPVLWRSRQGLWRPVWNIAVIAGSANRKGVFPSCPVISSMRMRIWHLCGGGAGGGGGEVGALQLLPPDAGGPSENHYCLMKFVISPCKIGIHLHWPIVQAWGRGSERTLPGNPCSGRCFVSVSGGRWDGPEVGEVWLNG